LGAFFQDSSYERAGTLSAFPICEADRSLALVTAPSGFIVFPSTTGSSAASLGTSFNVFLMHSLGLECVWGAFDFGMSQSFLCFFGLSLVISSLPVFWGSSVVE
jgi:hypothetical protein